jgi:septum formation protein
MIILASSSPRRSKLLKDAGIEFIVEPSDIEEVINENLEPKDIVIDLAKQKAQAVSLKHPKDIVIAADTIVVFNHEILGKPKDEEHAYQMLKMLSSEQHQVYTGVALQLGEKIHAFYSRADVLMKKLTDFEIKEYIKTKEPIDKAGAYGIQGLGGKLVESYQGDFFTIVGLPLKDLLSALNKFKNETQA